MTNLRNYILTTADDTSYKSLRQLIYSFNRSKEYENSSLIIYDLGLTLQQSQDIKRLEIESGNHLFFRKFKFEDYPHFVKSIDIISSWKPLLIYKASLEHRGNFIWLDSTSCILKKLDPVWEEIEEKCAYVPLGDSLTLKEKASSHTLKYLKVSEELRDCQIRQADIFGFSIQCETIKDLIYRWKDLALNKECMMPEDTNPNHYPDDHSLLSILLMQEEEKDSLELTKDQTDSKTALLYPHISGQNIFPVYLKPGAIVHYYFLIGRFFKSFGKAKS